MSDGGVLYGTIEQQSNQPSDIQKKEKPQSHINHELRSGIGYGILSDSENFNQTELGKLPEHVNIRLPSRETEGIQRQRKARNRENNLASSQINLQNLKLEILSGSSHKGNHAEVMKQMDFLENQQNKHNLNEGYSQHTVKTLSNPLSKEFSYK